MDWLQQLPHQLQDQIKSIINKDQSSIEVFNNLYNFFADDEESQQDSKRKKLNDDESIDPNATIFEIDQISIFSPIRKRMDLVFHLIEDNPSPVLSIVNPSNNIPELSFLNLKQSIKLCLILPILGNSTNPQKKGIALLCFWINDDQKDPIICQLNLDVIKKQMLKSNKLPSNIDQQFDCPKDSVILNPIQERILDYLKRQFKLCDINLISYLPSPTIFKNNFIENDDVAIVITDKKEPSIIMVECHKGAKDGVLIFLEKNEVNPSYLIFAFKKPILVFETTKIKKASYSNVTSSTFSLTIVVLNDRNENRTIEFSMIDNKFFDYIDKFIKQHNISDDSYNENLKENGKKEVKEDEDDDEEEDEDFKEGSESDVAEEYDSNVEEVEEGDVFSKNTEAI
ncbi:unnamed protein product [Candida verbasci]|uniref:Histone chaperone RTT106 n=1 Tax=Candida verbasci TaxID=1227364 RepID=A0A9W4U260_9ASCO|nr:unnamed protein product [Candida verbasci]